VEAIEQTVEICNPQNKYNDDQAVQDRFDLALHWDESVHKPQQDACRDNRHDDGGKWHFMFSIYFSGSMPIASSRSYE
jgi:hypothetical protein